MTLTGTIGADWLRKHGVTSRIEDTLLRDWRDFLEQRLLQELQLDADFSLGNKTRFSFLTQTHGHTIVEIEAFARRALDAFLARKTR